MTTIDLNADVGEGMSGDVALLDFVTSANVACGFHAGDEATMRLLGEAAGSRGVAVGAHVGYRDPTGFGRRPLDVAAHAVGAETGEQIAALAQFAVVRYVKPHGALYTRATRDRGCADAIVEAALAAGVSAVLGLPGSALLAAAVDAGLTPVAEGFADRGYLADGTLVPRDEPGALLGPDQAVQQGVRLAQGGTVGSLCVHGDSPGAVGIARRLREELRAAGVEAASFA